METTSQNTDIFEKNNPPAYGMLRTLTVLTFIGCALAYIGLIYSVATWGDYERQLAEAQDAQEKMINTNIGKYMDGSIEMLKKSHEYRYIIAGTTLLFTSLCLVGALRMRQLKKSGYPLYVIGELAPLAVSAVLLGFSFFGGIVMALSALVGIVFVILYSTQRKYLIYN